MVKSNPLDEVAENAIESIGCYVSTDCDEISEAVFAPLFAHLGFTPGIWFCRNGDVRLEAENITLDEALKYKQYGFVPMSRIRINMNRNKDRQDLVKKTLVPLVKQLEEMKQNMFFLSDLGGRAYLNLSEFYR